MDEEDDEAKLPDSSVRPRVDGGDGERDGGGRGSSSRRRTQLACLRSSQNSIIGKKIEEIMENLYAASVRLGAAGVDLKLGRKQTLKHRGVESWLS